MGDDRKLTYSERDRLRREGGGSGARPKSGRARADEEERSREALKAADSLFAHRAGRRAKSWRLRFAPRTGHPSSRARAVPISTSWVLPRPSTSRRSFSMRVTRR